MIPGQMDPMLLLDLIHQVSQSCIPEDCPSLTPETLYALPPSPNPSGSMGCPEEMEEDREGEEEEEEEEEEMHPASCRTPPPPPTASSHLLKDPIQARSSIQATIQTMDSRYRQHFSQFLGDPGNAQIIASRLDPIIQSQELPTAAIGVRFVLENWPLATRVTFLQTLFREWYADTAGLFFALLTAKEEAREGPSIACWMAGELLRDEPASAVAAFLFAWRGLSGGGDWQRIISYWTGSAQMCACMTQQVAWELAEAEKVIRPLDPPSGVDEASWVMEDPMRL
ncbi:MAG: hypothetical protein DHS80DRAFT_32856 [Piptocephalis tieghemiana]|nr:MAG: hypothetical protein DHS80DRAFT_32856 [Piptocephalis tieghemiana]